MKSNFTGQAILRILKEYPGYRLEDVLRLTPERFNFLIAGITLPEKIMRKDKKTKELKDELHRRMGLK